MKTLTITSLFPNIREPNKGIFNLYRIKGMQEYMDIEVIAPVAWFPFCTKNRPRGVPYIERLNGIKVYHPRFISFPKILKILDGLFFKFSLRKFNKKIMGADIIDAHFAWPDGYGAWRASRKSKAKFCITLHGLTCLFKRTRGYGKFNRRIKKRIIRMLEGADMILAVSGRIKDITSAYIKNNILLSPNGINSQFFFPSPKQTARRELKLPLEQKIVLSVGSPFLLKGFFELAYAVKELDILLYLVGKDEKNRKKLIDFLDENKIHNVILVGQKEHRELYKWYSAADIFVLASHSEGWPCCVMESLACGTPCVVTEEAGGEIISNGLGIITTHQYLTRDLEKALNINWDKKNLNSFIGKNSWKNTAKRTYRLFTDLLRKP